MITDLPRTAAHAGVGIACVPMWEWIHPELDWLQFVDVMICPTELSLQQMIDWKTRYGFGWDAVHVPWPLDVDRFEFRQRQSCERFLFINGWGGGPARTLDDKLPDYQRKGWEVILASARIAPDLQFVVHSLKEITDRLPPNIMLQNEAPSNADLYVEGDVCVQPSHYEGLGLQLLECQAAGLPLVTTDAAPMNEHNPLELIPTHVEPKF